MNKDETQKVGVELTTSFFDQGKLLEKLKKCQCESVCGQKKTINSDKANRLLSRSYGHDGFVIFVKPVRFFF